MKNDGQKGKPRGPGFYYGQPVASRLERFSWNRDKRHRQLKYPILIAAEIAERRHKDRHRRFNPPVPRIRNSVSTALLENESEFHLLKDTLQRSTILPALPYRTEAARLLYSAGVECVSSCEPRSFAYLSRASSKFRDSVSPRTRETRNSSLRRGIDAIDARTMLFF